MHRRTKFGRRLAIPATGRRRGSQGPGEIPRRFTWRCGTGGPGKHAVGPHNERGALLRVRGPKPKASTKSTRPRRHPRRRCRQLSGCSALHSWQVRHHMRLRQAMTREGKDSNHCFCVLDVWGARTGSKSTIRGVADSKPHSQSPCGIPWL